MNLRIFLVRNIATINEMIHTHNDNSVNFLSPGSGGKGGGEDFGDHLVVRGT